MLLAVDIGNTHIAAGLLDNKNIVAHWRISSTRERTEDETWIMMRSICDSQGYDIQGVLGVVVSSVVPDLTHVFEKMSKKYLGIDAVVVHSNLDIGITINYENPASVGADRLCNAVGGFYKHGGPLIIVDFGTATTFDVISKEGDYLGGIIAPGIEMSSSILHRRAAKLPRVYLRFPQSVIGQTTEHSMQAGLLYGSVHLIDGLTRQIEEELGDKAKYIATGGLALVLQSHLKTPYIHEPYLTLEGLKLIYERVRKNNT